jgi:hypothetical protein
LVSVELKLIAKVFQINKLKNRKGKIKNKKEGVKGRGTESGPAPDPAHDPLTLRTRKGTDEG